MHRKHGAPTGQGQRQDNLVGAVQVHRRRFDGKVVQGLFRGLNSGFEATRYHSLTVKPETLPETLEVTATTDDGLIMGLQHRKLPLHGVQFHPESIASENGHALLQNFLGGVDEEWFVLVHVEIEARAGAALAGLARALQSSQLNQPDETLRGLEDTAAAVEGMCRTLERMPEQCDPYIYFNRVRPYIHGWKDHPALPEGLLYEGVEAYGGKPQQFRGETGAQSSIVPTLDAALGVVHADDPLRQYLMEMRTYMPPRHRAFIEAWEQLRDRQGRSQLYRYVLERRQSESRLWDRFRTCVQGLCRFRQTHLDYADRYIQRQSQRTSSNPTGVGTGGTPFMTYLKKHLDETAALIAE